MALERKKKVNTMKTWATYLNMNIKRMRREKNMATLSIVRSITKSCRRSWGMKRTSLRMRSSRKVRSTDRPELWPAC